MEKNAFVSSYPIEQSVAFALHCTVVPRDIEINVSSLTLPVESQNYVIAKLTIHICLLLRKGAYNGVSSCNMGIEQLISAQYAIGCIWYPITSSYHCTHLKLKFQ